MVIYFSPENNNLYTKGKIITKYSKQEEPPPKTIAVILSYSIEASSRAAGTRATREHA